VCSSLSSYKSAVVFQFPKEYLSKADVGQIKDVISQVLAPDTNAQQPIQIEQQQAPDQTAPSAPDYTAWSNQSPFSARSDRY
jgi:hypothetical protein